jgi:hypothetical protein
VLAPDERQHVVAVVESQQAAQRGQSFFQGRRRQAAQGRRHGGVQPPALGRRQRRHALRAEGTIGADVRGEEALGAVADRDRRLVRLARGFTPGRQAVLLHDDVARVRLAGERRVDAAGQVEAGPHVRHEAGLVAEGLLGPAPRLRRVGQAEDRVGVRVNDVARWQPGVEQRLDRRTRGVLVDGTEG